MRNRTGSTTHRHTKFWCVSMSESNHAASSGIGSRLVLALIQNSGKLAKAYERLPEDARQLYRVAVSDLHKEIALLSANGQQEAERHKDNIAHIKSTLDSLDAVSRIKMYRTTVKVLRQVALIAFKVALATI